MKFHKIPGVYLTLFGQAKCKWLGAGKITDLEGKPRNKIVKFSGKETHLNSATNFIDQYEGGSNEIPPRSSINIFQFPEIPPGKRKWNFTCQLPSELPSSTTEKHGFITYKIVITFERSNNLNLEHTVAINVIRPFNLASDPSLRDPDQDLISRTFLTSFLETHPLRAKVTIPYRGFAVGQLVDLKVDIENPTFFDVKKVIVTLVKITDHKSQTPYPKIEKSIVKLERISAGQPFCRGNRKYKLYFHIPETVPTITDESCVILNVSYQIRVKVKVRFPHFPGKFC